jgi:hypothetical protein
MKGTGIALSDAKKWLLMDGDELVHVSGGPSPFALNVQVSGKRLGCGLHVLLAAQLEHRGYKAVVVAQNAESTSVLQGKKVAEEVERLGSMESIEENKDSNTMQHDLERKQALAVELLEWTPTTSTELSDGSRGKLLLERAKMLRAADSDIRLTHTEMVIGLARLQRTGVFYRRSSAKHWYVEAMAHGEKHQFPKLWHVLYEGKPKPDHWRYLVFLDSNDVVTTSDFVPIHVLPSKPPPSVPSSSSPPSTSGADIKETAVQLQVEKGGKWLGVVADVINDEWRSFRSLQEVGAPDPFVLYGAMGVRSFKRRTKNKLLSDSTLQWQIVAMLANVRRRNASALRFYVIPSSSSSADDIELVVTTGVAKIPAGSPPIDKDRVAVLQSLAAAWNKEQRTVLTAVVVPVKPEPAPAPSSTTHSIAPPLSSHAVTLFEKLPSWFFWASLLRSLVPHCSFCFRAGTASR